MNWCCAHINSKSDVILNSDKCCVGWEAGETVPEMSLKAAVAKRAMSCSTRFEVAAKSTTYFYSSCSS